MSDPRHTYRYPEHRYQAAKAKAASEGTTVTQVIIDRLDDYVDGRSKFIDQLERSSFLSPEKATELRAEGEVNPIVAEVLHSPPLPVQEAMAHEAIDTMEATGELTVNEARRARETWSPSTPDTVKIDNPQCHAYVNGKPCPCAGFDPQPKNLLRCTCGHPRGVHE